MTLTNHILKFSVDLLTIQAPVSIEVKRHQYLCPHIIFIHLFTKLTSFNTLMYTIPDGLLI